MHCCRTKGFGVKCERGLLFVALCVSPWTVAAGVNFITKCFGDKFLSHWGCATPWATPNGTATEAQNKNNLCIARWHVHLFKSLLCVFCVVGISRVGKHQCVCVGSFFKSHFQCAREMNSIRQSADLASLSQNGIFLRARALVSYCEKWKCSSFVRDYAKRGAQKAAWRWIYFCRRARPAIRKGEKHSGTASHW